MGVHEEISFKETQKVLPKPLLICIQEFFENLNLECMLVGGTALSGFYAAHRISDDLDLFCKSEIDFKGALLKLKNLTQIGVQFRSESTSQYHYHAICEFQKHRFTIDLVLDENIFLVGEYKEVQNSIKVVNLETLLKMKSATLVSRCSEKDLYDLIWLFQKFESLDIQNLIEFGKSIDAGVSAENILVSLLGANLRESACHFSHTKNAKKVFSEISQFKENLIKQLVQYEKNKKNFPLKFLFKEVKKRI